MTGTGNELVWINESFGLNDAGILIMTSYVDLRQPQDRTPIKSLVRGCERRYALEDCDTFMISSPSRWRSHGEGLIRDVREGQATEETISEWQQISTNPARERSARDLNEALKLLDTSIRLSLSESHTHTQTKTERSSQSLTYAKEWWVFCTSIRPEEGEWEVWRGTLPSHYDHVSEIGRPAKFAQALAHMVAEQLGPQGKKGTFNTKTGTAESEMTDLPSQWVLHGPVVYTDSVHQALEGITDDTVRTAATIFTKGKDHAGQQEYRFAIFNDGRADESVMLKISGMLRDSLGLTNHGLVPQAAGTFMSAPTSESEPPEASNKGQARISQERTLRRRTGERKEWKLETKSSDGQVLSSKSGFQEAFTERTAIETQGPGETNFQDSMRVGQDRNETPETLTGSDTTDAPEESDTYLSDQAAVKELALDEFEWGNDISNDVLLAIPVKTVTGRVYKSFEEMWSDPTCPTTPMSKIWEEDANTPDEIVATYRTIATLNMQMGYVEEQFRQDLASAGWYAMLCIRNIYSRLGDIIETVSIERNRFIIIRLKSSESLNAKGRIVIAPSGAYAYSLHLPNKEQLGYGGQEWGTTFFPIGSAVETLERYGWSKKVI